MGCGGGRAGWRKSGLDADGHYSSAYDLAQMARRAMREDVFAEMVATPEELHVIATNIGVIATYWLSYQFVMNPRKYNEQEAIQAELHQVSVQIISLMAPYLRGRSRQIFDDLVSGKLPKREFYDYLPPKDGAAARNESKDV